MKSIIKEKDEFISNLNSIREFIVINKEQSEIIEKICSSKLDVQGINLNEFEKKYLRIMNTPVIYNAVIISIYGCYEAYIDKLASALLDFWVENTSNYDQISESIRNKHIQKSGDFLSNSQRYQNIGITEQRVIKNLDMCLMNEPVYMLNKELILSHSGNLNSTQLMQFLAELGLKTCRTRIINSFQYIEYISEKYELCNDDAKKIIHSRNNDDIFLFKELTQLVEQRNRVAHGWSVDERLSKAYLIDNIIPFMKMLGCVISELFINEFVEILYKTGLLKEFDDAIDVFNKRILCINIKDANLKRSDYIFANNEKEYVVLKIIEIQCNNQTVEEIMGGDKDIGLLVDSDIKKNWKFYYT